MQPCTLTSPYTTRGLPGTAVNSQRAIYARTIAALAPRPRGTAGGGARARDDTLRTSLDRKRIWHMSYDMTNHMIVGGLRRYTLVNFSNDASIEARTRLKPCQAYLVYTL